MKKLMAMLTAVMLVMPFANVKAETAVTKCSVSNSCFVYTPGEEVNFYRNDQEASTNNQNAGISTIILEDGGAGSQYVKTLVLSPFGTSVPYYDKEGENEPLESVKKDHISEINKSQDYQWDSARHTEAGDLEISYPTLSELVSVFGATQKDDKTYSIDVTKYGALFEIAAIGTYGSKGFYTGTFDKENDKVWVVKYTMENEKLTAIDIVEEKMDDNNTYSYLPVVYFDKTYDCHSRVTQDEMACYSCDSDYRWLKKGSQAPTCTLVENVSSQGSCVKAVKTGVEDYILEFVGILLVCGTALVIVKRKDLFKAV